MGAHVLGAFAPNRHPDERQNLFFLQSVVDGGGELMKLGGRLGGKTCGNYIGLVDGAFGCC